jgi:hypothetical protein
MEGPQINITIEEHQEAMKEAARSARMTVINNLDQESREKLKKQKFQVYRRKTMNQPATDQMLSLQETLLGCISEMPGNLTFL